LKPSRASVEHGSAQDGAGKGLAIVTPREHLELIVHPNMREMTANLDDLRLAFNAIAAVDALAAHIYWWAFHNQPAAVGGVGDDTEYRAKVLAPRSRDFQLVFEVAKATKHVRLIRGRPPSVRAADQLASSGRAWGTGNYGEAVYGGSPQIHIEPIGETAIAADGAIRLALAFLEEEMARLQIP
jgi:hypothetical protein